jgi:hypothetical protein
MTRQQDPARRSTGPRRSVGGLIGTGAAATVVALLTILIWFIDIIAPPLGLPERCMNWR